MSKKSKNKSLRAGHVWPVSLNVAAPLLGVSKGHLCQVLKGHRTSQPVKAGYAALVSQQVKGAA